MVRILQRTSNWKYLLPLFLLFCGFGFLFSHYQAQLTALAGEKIEPLDVRSSYTLAEVSRDFGKLGEEGRELYRFIVGRVDMVYPLVYGPFLILVLAYLLRKLTEPGSRLILIALLPALGMLFDYLENSNTLRLLAHYPNLSEPAVTWGAQMTRLKHGVLLFSMGLAIVLAVVLVVKKFRSKELR